MDMISNGCFPGEPAFPPHTTNRTESTEILLHRRFDWNAVCSNTEDPSMVSNKKGMSSSNLVAVDAAKKTQRKKSLNTMTFVWLKLLHASKKHTPNWRHTVGVFFVSHPTAPFHKVDNYMKPTAAWTCTSKCLVVFLFKVCDPYGCGFSLFGQGLEAMFRRCLGVLGWGGPLMIFTPYNNTQKMVVISWAYPLLKGCWGGLNNYRVPKFWIVGSRFPTSKINELRW